MNGRLMLYCDQYGQRFFARTVAELRKQIELGGSRISKMYVDKRSGRTVHVGYVIGGHWCTAYLPFEGAA